VYPLQGRCSRVRVVSSLAVAAALIAVWARSAVATPIALAFDERLPTYANGLSVAGVTFSGTDPYSPSYLGYGDPLYWRQLYLAGETLSGSTFVPLALDFASPTSLLEFGVATPDRFQDPGTQIQAWVDLFDANHELLTTIPLTLTQDYHTGSSPEARFPYDGGPVSSAVLRFDPYAYAPFGFQLDNLTFLDDAVNLVRSTGASGGSETGANGANAAAVASSGHAIEHAVATGGAGGSGTYPGGPGGNGGNATASAAAQTSGAENASATAVARGGNGGYSGSGYGTPGTGGNASASAQATSVAGSATAIADALGAAATGTARADSTQGGDATASVLATGSDGVVGGDVALANAVDGSTSGELVLTQEARGGNSGGNSDGSANGGGDAQSSLTRSVSAESFVLSSRAFGGRSGDSDAVAGTPANGGRAEARGNAFNDAGSVTVELVAVGGTGSEGYGALPGGAGGDAVRVARGGDCRRRARRDGRLVVSRRHRRVRRRRAFARRVLVRGTWRQRNQRVGRYRARRQQGHRSRHR
jgi:hypothetical protein